ncbi:MAG: stage II sporulation protein D [Clostridia bacterium]|nr:stage II sporulation protein D [Clostridia bacterium]
MKYRIDFKRLLLVILTLIIGAVLLRLCFSSCSKSAAPEAEDTMAPTMIPIEVSFERIEGEPVAETEGPTATPQADSEITVYNHRTDELIKMPLETYIERVVSAEMPASFDLEALKAQAVAARTFSCYCILHRGCGSNEEADICTNSQCCQAYTEEVSERVCEAVQATCGEVMLYDGEVIEALFHASSGGSTEDSENVFSAARPYLRAVASLNEVGSRQQGEVRLSLSDLIKKVNSAYPNANLKVKNLIEQVGIESRFESGRVETLRIGETTITGKQARKLFSLDSTMFEIMFTDEEIVFTTKGFGHGVGMSQSGANGMAQSGSDYIEILLHYYTGVTVSEYTLPQER